MSKEEKEWCIALDDVGWYDNSLFGKLPIFHKGELATKEKVFFEIPDITEEEYAKYFRPATEKEISIEQCDMKTIKEKAMEAERNARPLFETLTTSTGRLTSIYNQNDMINMFEQGANYVLDILEQALTPQRCLTDIGMDICPEALVKTALQTIEDLKR